MIFEKKSKNLKYSVWMTVFKYIQKSWKNICINNIYKKLLYFAMVSKIILEGIAQTYIINVSIMSR